MVERINALVGARIRSERNALGMSQAALASELGLSRTSITNVESGIQALSIEHLYTVATVLGMHARDLLPDVVLPQKRKGRRSPDVAALLERLKDIPDRSVA